MQKFVFLFIVVFLPVQNIFSSVVVLEKGDVVTGVVKENRGSSILFQSKYGKLTIEKKNIRKLIEDESTIKSEIIEYQGSKIDARFLFEDAEQKIYITDKGQIIRILFKERKVKPDPMMASQKSRLSVNGTYGIMKQPYVLFNGSEMSWAYDISINTPGFEISYLFYPIPALGFGAEFSKYFYNLDKQYNALDYEITEKIIHDFYGLNLLAEFSVLGALGKNNIHDFGLGVVAGISYVRSNLLLEMSLSPNPELSGSNFHFSAGGYLYYSLKIFSFLGIFARAQVQFFSYQTVYRSTGIPVVSEDPQYQVVQSTLDQLSKTPFDMPGVFTVNLGVRIFF